MDRRDFLKQAAALSTAALLGGDIAEAVNNSRMKIVVLTGSPRWNGNTNHMAERFIAGAQEKGHQVFRFDCATHEIGGCLGCNRCGMNGDCVLSDDFDIVRPHIVGADMVVFVTPMYYFGFSAQLKRVVDRFYAINGKIKGARKKTAFLMAYADTDPKEAQPMIMHYQTLADYLGWEDVGMVVAPGIWTAGSVKNTRYAQAAYELGKSL